MNTVVQQRGWYPHLNTPCINIIFHRCENKPYTACSFTHNHNFSLFYVPSAKRSPGRQRANKKIGGGDGVGWGVLTDLDNKVGDISVLFGASFTQRSEQARPLTFYETIYLSQHYRASKSGVLWINILGIAYTVFWSEYRTVQRITKQGCLVNKNPV
jgi:hypothetical protein